MAYDAAVFINCPFDEQYRPIFDALVFAIHDCGFIARCTREVDDGSAVRIDTIVKIISECKFGVHDISRTELDVSSGLPRFNMPMELGLFLGAKRFGRGPQREKCCLILDQERYLYQRFLSDVAGQDIKAHQGDPKRAVTLVRDWLRTSLRGTETRIPSGSMIWRRFEMFRQDLPEMCRELHLDPGELIFNDYTTLVVAWLRERAE